MQNSLIPSKQYIRFFNATCNEKLCFYMFNKCECTNLCFGEITKHIQTDFGTATFKICDSQGNQLASAFSDISPGNSYIVCALSNNNSYSLYIIEDKTKKSDSNYAALRICMLSERYPLSNIMADGQDVICHIKPMDVSNYVAFLPRSYNFEMYNVSNNKSTNTKSNDNIILPKKKLHLNSGERYTMLIFDDEKPDNILTSIVI